MDWIRLKMSRASLRRYDSTLLVELIVWLSIYNLHKQTRFGVKRGFLVLQSILFIYT